MSESIHRPPGGREPAVSKVTSDDGNDEIHAFIASMPPHYARSFEVGAIKTHAKIVAGRGSRTAYVDVWSAPTEGTLAVCVVADDRPGLLSLIASAFASREMDVVAAHAFVRNRSDGRREAVDLFWIRRAPEKHAPPIDLTDLRLAENSLERLLKNRAEAEAAETPAATSLRMRATEPTTRVGFEEQNGKMVLVVETRDRPALLLTITRSLYSLGLQIVGSKVTTTSDRAKDYFHVEEHDGSPLTPERRRGVESGVLAAIAMMGAIAERSA